MRRIGQYEILDEIGRGGMGVVYRGVDPLIGRKVAIKVIRLKDVQTDDETKFLRDRLVREAKAAGILSHPGIVTIYQIAEENDQAYIAMEYVEGISLEKMLAKRDRPPSREAVVALLRQTADALDYAHRRGIIHRDIKPANIIMNEEPGNISVKICDFGIAKLTASSGTTTQLGMIVGSPYYMSPQQVLGESLTGKTDQWSLAVIAYQMLCGERPFYAERLDTLFAKILTQPPPPIYSHNASLGLGVMEALQRALEKEPDKRYSTCTEFAHVLIASFDQTPGWTPVAKARPKAQPQAPPPPLPPSPDLAPTDLMPPPPVTRPPVRPTTMSAGAAASASMQGQTAGNVGVKEETPVPRIHRLEQIQVDSTPVGPPEWPVTGTMETTGDRRPAARWPWLVGAMAGLVMGAGIIGYWRSQDVEPLEIRPTELGRCELRIPYAHQFSVKGGTPPYRWTVQQGALPGGLSLEPATGMLSGTPAQDGTYNFVVRVTDKPGIAADRQLRLSVVKSVEPRVEPPKLTGVTPPPARVGDQYSYRIPVNGGTPPLSWSMKGSPPRGLTLDPSSGTLHGTPAAAGAYRFGVQVLDSRGARAAADVRMTVEQATNALRVTPGSASAGISGQPYAHVLRAGGGKAPYRWAIADGVLPPGIALSADGALSGTPRQAGMYRYSARVTDAAGQSARGDYLIEVKAAEPPPKPPVVITGTPPAGMVGKTFSHTLRATEGAPPYSWSLQGSVPPGLRIDPSSGAVSGTPTDAGKYSFTARVTDAKRQTATAGAAIEVTCPARGRYRGSVAGTLIWLDSQGLADNVVITGAGASRGSLEGRLPGEPVEISVNPPEVVVEPPSERNCFDRLVIRGSNPAVKRVSITWRIIR